MYIIYDIYTQWDVPGHLCSAGLLTGSICSDGCICSGTGWHICLKKATRFHDEQYHEITDGIFDTTPLGRILNRFSKDVYTIDETIPRSLRGFIMTVFNVVSTIIVILIATPIFAVVIVPLGFLYAIIQVRTCTYSLVSSVFFDL